MRKGYVALLITLTVFFTVSCAAMPTPTSALSEIESSGIDTDSWALVPAGEFIVGQFDHEGFIEESYEIMVTEVTNNQYADFLAKALDAAAININENNQITGYYPGDINTGGRHELDIPAGEYIYISLNDPANRIAYDGSNFSVKKGYGNHPVTMVSWFGASAYAKFYNYRLPSEDEWQKAARGDDNRAFPWGVGEGHAYSNYYHSKDPFETEQGFSDTTPVGFYNGNSYGDFHTKDNSSPYGVYDMAGNAGEWTADKIEGYHYRHIRGGSKSSYEIDCRIWKYDSAEPQHVSPSVGFRCVRDTK